ncbi:hypothetical protein TREPR_0276 [Treponema primitia ZAS-2]|uniref:Uncharacterized protein n=1 Tax=Treponema primitia (strain ATCC BAA-887 / DSM 12427 / ZAS-2) TaxID=545694 RepID=F5YLH1_TREPZ|nr:hypothetical protein TREPR_0276 [Treponema primitia ZAS-2]
MEHKRWIILAYVETVEKQGNFSRKCGKHNSLFYKELNDFSTFLGPLLILLLVYIYK